MVDIMKTIKFLNMALGFCTIIVGAYILVILVTNLKASIKLANIPILTLPFFFSLFGVMVLSAQFEIPILRRNCQFLNHKIGVLIFYVYIGSLVQGFGQSNNDTLGFFALVTALGYYVLAVLMAVLACFGESKTNDKLSTLQEKIVRDD